MHGLPDHLPHPPEALRRQLGRTALPLRSLWFPTRPELTAWYDSAVPVYVRFHRSGGFEIGPRVDSMWSSVFSPVYVASLTPDATGTQLSWSRRLPHLTLAVLASWAVMSAAWAVVLLQGDHVLSTPFWGAMVAGTVLAPTIGWWKGGAALADAVPWLTTALAVGDEEDW